MGGGILSSVNTHLLEDTDFMPLHYLNFLGCMLIFMNSSMLVKSLFSLTTLESASMSSIAQW